jgi:hypothetical protein
MQGRTPAQLFALVIGGVLVVVGIVGFFYSTAFGSPGETDAVFGVFDVNGWHNVVHILSGAAGLALFANAAGARLYAIGLAVVYTVVTVWGFILGDGEAILGFLPINTEDNVLHALIALTGYGAFAASPAGAAPTPAPRTT